MRVIAGRANSWVKPWGELGNSRKKERSRVPILRKLELFVDNYPYLPRLCSYINILKKAKTTSEVHYSIAKTIHLRRIRIVRSEYLFHHGPKYPLEFLIQHGLNFGYLSKESPLVRLPLYRHCKCGCP